MTLLTHDDDALAGPGMADRYHRTDGAFKAPNAPSVLDLREEYVRPGQPHFEDIRKVFENCQGTVEEEYYAEHIAAAAVLVRSGGRYKIRIKYDSGLATPELAATLRSARLQERQASALLRGKPQRSSAQTIYTIMVHLLAVWDSAARPGADQEPRQARLTDEIAGAEHELEQELARSDKAAKKSAVALYIAGLPVGVGIGYLIVLAIWHFPRQLAGGETSNFNREAGLSLALGAIGAVMSVMIRITLGQKVEIGSDQGVLMTIIAGAFRPIMGAIFGAMLYILISGGLIPFEPGSGADISLFYAGLAFLAGFSERWAQDTVIHSMPAIAGTDGQRGQPNPPPR